ncbi:hypothetical protein PVAR5_0272 [Paecilomyces variotii No. 5]|uniref:Uncharacterized protein n=1 Tax=Byssochlamys spectabilis (strain No. 5 / NBRC 109023) TaxID=1356009 RepID=V5FIY2_BYSSN|nr:hypothetical protein PVAR5_0272 [Paecilomyces variotii No. 5]
MAVRNSWKLPDPNALGGPTTNDPRPHRFHLPRAWRAVSPDQLTLLGIAHHIHAEKDAQTRGVRTSKVTSKSISQSSPWSCSIVHPLLHLPGHAAVRPSPTSAEPGWFDGRLWHSAVQTHGFRCHRQICPEAVCQNRPLPSTSRAQQGQLSFPNEEFMDLSDLSTCWLLSFPLLQIPASHTSVLRQLTIDLRQRASDHSAILAQVQKYRLNRSSRCSTGDRRRSQEHLPRIHPAPTTIESWRPRTRLGGSMARQA